VCTIIDRKHQPVQDIGVYGSLSQIDALERLGMIDEYHLLIHHLMRYPGKPLLHGEAQAPRTLGT
jgi:hypothetical protein